jgi:ribosome-binding factor A
MKPHRIARVNEAVREVASTTVLFEVRDPRVKNVTVTRAEVSPDMHFAKVYVSVMGTENEQRLALYGLNNAAGFVQRKLADRLATRFVPQVEFVLDQGVKNSLTVAAILREEKLKSAPAEEPESDEENDEFEDDSEVDDEPETEDAAGTAVNPPRPPA